MISGLLLLLLATPPAEGGVSVNEGDTSAGVALGYRYVPNPFFAESESSNDPVVSTYLGAPTLGLHFEYMALDNVSISADLAWTYEHHDLASEGWVETQALDFALSAGFMPQLDLWYRPYGLLGIDQVALIVRDKIKSKKTPASTFSGTVGAHAALGVYVPSLVAAVPGLAARAELRYTFAPTAQRGLSYFIMGVGATVGLEYRLPQKRAGHAWP